MAVVQAKSNRELQGRQRPGYREALDAETTAQEGEGGGAGTIGGGARQAEAVLGFLKDDVLAAARPEEQAGGLGKEVTVLQAINAAEPKIARRSRTSRTSRRASATR